MTASTISEEIQGRFQKSGCKIRCKTISYIYTIRSNVFPSSTFSHVKAQPWLPVDRYRIVSASAPLRHSGRGKCEEGNPVTATLSRILLRYCVVKCDPTFPLPSPPNITQTRMYIEILPSVFLLLFDFTLIAREFARNFLSSSFTANHYVYYHS